MGHTRIEVAQREVCLRSHVTKQNGELLYDFMVLVANVSIPTFVSLLSIVH